MNKVVIFTSLNGTDIPKAVKAASQSDVVVLVLGDCSTSESTTDVYKTSEKIMIMPLLFYRVSNRSYWKPFVQPANL